ncbi:DUF3884 family protein [Streptococcus thoraltensis]|uniref:DUF3884 family protein n=1 Tax=Streptococcus thoraltensis TaxID=55085 RepID=UPI00036146EF|nr:DUF3884 family protein [Streptococcus thoraltensis]MDY4760530.1 DUF3884 family protein [Streptococcus thoraltensis]
MKKLYGNAFKEVYIVDFSLMREVPLFSKEYNKIGTWFTTTGQRWICHTEIPKEEFKNMILSSIVSEDVDKVKFYKDYIPFSTNHEIPF